MAIHLTRPDAEWLHKLLQLIEYIYEEYPELFSEEDEDMLRVAKQLIEDINS